MVNETMFILPMSNKFWAVISAATMLNAHLLTWLDESPIVVLPEVEC